MRGGAAFFVGGWLQQAGLITATVTNTGFLTALYVVITPFIAWAWSGKRPNPLVWPAAALSALGTWLLGGGTLSAFSTGDMLVAFSAVLWAFHVVITGRAAQFRRPIGFTAVQFAIVAALAGSGAFLFETVTRRGARPRPGRTSPTSACCRARSPSRCSPWRCSTRLPRRPPSSSAWRCCLPRSPPTCSSTST